MATLDPFWLFRTERLRHVKLRQIHCRFGPRSRTMLIKIAVAASLTLVATASRAEGNEACIRKATETVPRVSGLVIKKARTRPVPPSILATWQGQARPIIVDVDIVATGVEETQSYICVMTKGSAHVRRVMS